METDPHFCVQCALHTYIGVNENGELMQITYIYTYNRYIHT